MRVFFIALGVVFLIWIVSLIIQRLDKQKRERDIQKRLEEKKKEAEESERSPFRR
jgi:hypothetical protein